MELSRLMGFVEVLLKWPVMKGSSFLMKMMGKLDRNLACCPTAELAMGFRWESRSYFTGIGIKMLYGLVLG